MSTRLPAAAGSLREIVRRSLPLLAIAYLADASFIFIFLIALQSYLPESLGTSTALAGWALAAFGAAKLCSQVASGLVADRVGTRRAMVGGAALLVVADVSMLPLAHIAVYAVIAAAAVEGLGSSMLWPALYAAGSGRFQSDERTRFTSLLTLATVAALVTALGGGTLLNLYVGFNAAMLAPIAFTASAFVIALMLRVDDALAVAESRAIAPSIRDLALMLRSRRRTAFAAIVLAEAIALGALTAAFRAYGRDVVGVSLLREAVMLAPAALLGALAVLAGGALADRVGARRVMVPGFAASGVAVVLLSQFTHPAFVVVAAIVGGAGFGIAVPTIASTMMALAEGSASRGGIIGWFMTMDGLGHAAGPAAAALILSFTSAAGVLLLTGAGFIAVAAIAASGALETRAASRAVEPQPQDSRTQDPASTTGGTGVPPMMRSEGRT